MAANRIRNGRFPVYCRRLGLAKSWFPTRGLPSRKYIGIIKRSASCSEEGRLTLLVNSSDGSYIGPDICPVSRFGSVRAGGVQLVNFPQCHCCSLRIQLQPRCWDNSFPSGHDAEG